MKCKGSDLLHTMEIMRRQLVAGQTDRNGYLAGIAELFQSKFKHDPATDIVTIGDGPFETYPPDDMVIKCL